MAYRSEANISFASIAKSDGKRSAANAKACAKHLALLRKHHPAAPARRRRPVQKPVENARDWLFVKGSNAPKTLADIAAEVCRKHRVSLTAFRSPRRGQQFVQARFEFYWRARNETEKSLPQIGRYVNRDHTTIMHGIRKYEAALGLTSEGGET
jgi:hypothetical protein